MPVLETLVRQAYEHGQANLITAETLDLSRHLSSAVLERHASAGTLSAIDHAIDSLERHPRLSRLRETAYRLAEGEDAAAICDHLVPIIGGERGSAMMAALYLLACDHAGRAPELQVTTALNWCAALQRLFDDLAPEKLETFLRPLLNAYPEMGFLRELEEIIAYTPRSGGNFRDIMEASVQLAPARDAHHAPLVVALSGGEGRLGLPHTILHRWFAARPAHMLYLRDRSGRFYGEGIDVLGESWEAMREAVRSLAGLLSADEVIILCNSAAGIPGLRLGMQLGAKRVAAFSATPHGAGRPAGPRGTPEQRMHALDRDMPLLRDDRRAGPGAEMLIVHAADNRQDTAIAEKLAADLDLRLLRLPGRNRHNTILEAMREGVLGDILAWLTDASAELPDGGP
jgi:hypothetical protein